MTNRIVVILQVMLLSTVMLFSIGMQYGQSDNALASLSEKGKHVLVASSSLYLPVSNNQEQSDTLHTFPSLRPVNQLLSLDAINKLKESLMGYKNSNYIYYSICLIRIGLAIPDIIYPFNYFW
ncbi:hypothetical protein [Saccharicrinis fermentans]|nr:hypothetical protein [Saccharicrinis fermentans]